MSSPSVCAGSPVRGSLHVYKEEITMPKIKTCRAAAKRFKKTGSGKLVRNKAYKSHILTKKSQKRKRNLRKQTVIDQTNLANMKKAMPYL